MGVRGAGGGGRKPPGPRMPRNAYLRGNTQTFSNLSISDDMLDLDKLWKKLEDALAAETPESLAQWLDEQRRKDREAGVTGDDYI